MFELDSLKSFLHNNVKFDEGKITVGTLINIVLTDPVFYSYAIGVDVESFCAGLNLPKEQVSVQEERFQDKIDVLEISHNCEADDFEKEKILLFQTRLNGWGKHDTPYDMGLAPVVEYINIPIVLNEEVIVYTSTYSCKEKHEHDYGQCGKFAYAQYDLGTKPFTLIDILHSVFSDLKFYGMPGSVEKSNCDKIFENGLTQCPMDDTIDDDELNAFDVEEDEQEDGNDL
jgi:hypothetical protein